MSVAINLRERVIVHCLVAYISIPSFLGGLSISIVHNQQSSELLQYTVRSLSRYTDIMLSRYLLYGFSLCWAILALSIPQHDAQQPLLSNQQHNRIHPHSTSVILEFSEDGDSMERGVEIPLRTLITAGELPIRILRCSTDGCLGVDLSRHLNTVKIVAATTEKGLSTSLEKLHAIICQVAPEISVEERAATEAGMESKVWPWFGVKDGRIRLEDASSRWFLGGRAVESLECR
jgi:hypothetical protein